MVLKNCVGLCVTNSDDPPGKYHTKDLFVAHKSLPNRCKFVGRVDDRFPMPNGENVLPFEYEGAVVEDALVKEAVIFGVGRSVLGLLVFRSEKAKDLTDQEFVSAIWPLIEKINSITSQTARIQRQMIVPLPAGRIYSHTDKSTFVRAGVYSEFEPEIEQAYQRMDQASKYKSVRRV